MDWLFWRLKPEDMELDRVRCFPWILWLIWKTRNDKIFNGLIRSPEEIMTKVISEYRAWKEAIKNSEPKSTIVAPNESVNVSSCFGDMELCCRTDAAWKEDENTCGLGWCLMEPANSPIYVGLKGTRRCLSATHAELLGLIWVMRCIIDIKSTCTYFVTDCKELLTITESPQE